MVKKIKSKKKVKQSVKNAEVSKVKKVEKVEPVKESRGVKKGTKRGKYKNKYNEFKNSVQETVTENNESINIDTKEVVQETEQKVNTDNSGNDKYSRFLKEYGSTENTNEIIEEPPITEIKTETVENKSYDFNNTQNSEPNVNQGSQNSKPNESLSGIRANNAQLVNGYMLLALCDFVVPNGILWLYGKVDERAKKVNSSNTKLDKDQKESLKESAHLAAQYIFEKVNPLLIFFIGMGAMYATNIQHEISKIPKEVKVRKPKQEIKKPVKKKK